MMKLTIGQLRSIIREAIETELAEEESLENACWSTHVAYGFKEKDGRRVPNCVPKKKRKKK